MATIPGTGTCLSFTENEPPTLDQPGYEDNSVVWTPAAELRVAGDLNATRALNTSTNLCTGLAEKTLGAIDNGSQQIELGFKFDDGGQVILHNAFHNNTRLWVRRTLANGHKTYYEAVVSSEGDTTAEGTEVLWKGQIELIGARVDVAP